MVEDGCRSNLVNVVSRVPQGSVWGLLILENELYSYADDSTLVAVVSSPLERTAVAESLNRDVHIVSEWCSLWEMRLNESKTKTMIVSWSCKMYPHSPSLAMGETDLKESVGLDIFGVTLAFEKQLRSVSRAASERLGALRKSWRVNNLLCIVLKTSGNKRLSMAFKYFMFSRSWWDAVWVIFCGVVLGCQYTLFIGPCSQWRQFLRWLCAIE